MSIIVLVMFGLNGEGAANNTLTINQVADEIKKGNVIRIIEEEDRLIITLKSNQENSLTKNQNPPLLSSLPHWE